MKKTALFRILLVITAFITASCQFDAPIRELADAKSAISNAIRYGAATYASEELEQAKTLIKDSHTKVKEEKKDEAVKLAIEAKNAADAAYEKSIPLVADATIKNAESILKDAYDANASEYCPEIYQSADNMLQKAKEYYSKPDFRESFHAAEKAEEEALLAKTTSLENITDLEIRIDAVNTEIKRISDNKGEQYAAEELKSAKESSGKAAALLDDKKILEALPLISDAEKSVAAAGEKEKQYSTVLKASDSINNAREILKQAENALADEYAPEEYTAASELIIKAEEEQKNGNYDSSEKYSAAANQKAVESWNIALQGKDSFQQQIDGLKQRYSFLEENGALTLAANEMKSASSNITDAEKYLADNNLRSCRDSIQNADNDLATAESKDPMLSSLQKLKTAEREYNALNTEANKTKYRKDLDSAFSWISKGKEQHSQKNFTDAELSANNALLQIDRIKISIASSQPGQVVSGETYTVKYNPKDRDCLWKIAAKIYKRADLWPLIYAANRDKIKDPDLIFPGQKFVIPPVPDKKDSGSKEKNSSSNDMILPSQTKEDEGNPDSSNNSPDSDTSAEKLSI